MKYLIIATLAGIMSWSCGYHTGCVDGGAAAYDQAFREARARYERQEEQDKRVQRIIAQENGYKKGFETCQEQF